MSRKEGGRGRGGVGQHLARSLRRMEEIKSMIIVGWYKGGSVDHAREDQEVLGRLEINSGGFVPATVDLLPYPGRRR